MLERLRHHSRQEGGQGLVELIVALTVLAIGIGSLLTVLTSSALSLQRSGQKGTALVLAEKQIELYRNLSYADIRLDQSSVTAISGSDPYVTANSFDPNIPLATGQVTDTTVGATPNCDGTDPAHPECWPIRYVDPADSPDHRRYRVDTYIHADNPNGGDTVDVVYVVVRNAQIATLPILARSATTFSSINVANVNGKSIVSMSFTAQKAGLTNTPVDANAITANLSGGTNETGTISFFVLAPPNTPSAPCTGVLWTLVGTANVTSGGGPYHPSGSYTPTTSGIYYWYATYSGDSTNKKASSICGASMAHMTVQATKWSPTLTVSTTAANGFVGTAIPASAITGTLAGSSGYTTGSITFMAYGPSASPPAVCTTTVGGLWANVGGVIPNGNGSYSPTGAGFTPGATGTYWYYAAFPADTTNNGATSLCNNAGMAKTVVTTPPDTFTFSVVGSQTAGTQFTLTITAQKYLGGADPGYSGTKTLVFTGPSTSPKGNAPTYPATVSFLSGIAVNVPFTLYKAETTSITATDALITGSTIPSFTVGTGPMTGLTVASPGTQTAGTAFGTTVTATDTWGNTIVGYNGTKAMTWTNPLSSPAPVNKAPDYGGAATSVLFNNGVGAVGQITLYNAALTTLKATATAGGFTGTSPSFTVVPDSASSFAFAAIGAQVAGTAFGATLTAKDQWANVATNFTGSKAITWGGAANSPNGTPPVLPTPVAFAAGVGSTGAAIQLYKAASTTLTATSGAASGSSNAFNVSAAPGLLTMSACGTVKTKNLTWTFTVTRGKDAYGNNDANAASAVTVTANYSDTANGGNKGKVAPATLNIAGGSTTTTNFTVTNPAKSGETVTLTASAPGYTTSPTCTYSTP